jgi:hypothetical protein
LFPNYRVLLFFLQAAKNKPQGSRKFQNIYRKESREALKIKSKFTSHAQAVLRDIAEQVGL